MATDAPTLVAINHDDYHAQHVGRTADGRQFFLTTPFEPGSADGQGNEFVALYIFDAAGKLIEARIDAFGPRSSLDESARGAMYSKRMEELGPVTFERIEVAPFEVERFGTTFGLIANWIGDGVDQWTVELMPGNYMAFFEPWDSGEYDT